MAILAQFGCFTLQKLYIESYIIIINRLLTFTKLVGIFINVRPVCYKPVSDLSIKFYEHCQLEMIDDIIFQFFFSVIDDLWELLEKRITKRHCA